jgi:hypothetical protein
MENLHRNTINSWLSGIQELEILIKPVKISNNQGKNQGTREKIYCFGSEFGFCKSFPCADSCNQHTPLHIHDRQQGVYC